MTLALLLIAFGLALIYAGWSDRPLGAILTGSYVAK